MERGEYLLKIMGERGYNAMSLAKASGVPYTTIRSMIERNLSNASIDNVLRIGKVLGVDAETLGDPKSSSAEIDGPTFSKEAQVVAVKYDKLDDKGKHTVDTVLDMEYNRIHKPYLVPIAAHEREGATEEDMQHDLELLRKIKEKHNRG